MSASIFSPGAAVNVNVNGTLVPQSFTGTSGQTTFNVTAFSYTVGTNSLLVFINGQKQQVGRDFIETSSTSFTLVEGVQEGDNVDIIGFPQIDLIQFQDARGVNFTQKGTGSVTRTVQDKLEELVSLLDFGAVGDGIADDTVPIQKALDSSATVIDGGNLTYKISAALIKTVAANKKFTIRNANFVSSGIPTSTTMLTLTGGSSLGTYPISPAAQGSTTITLSSGSVTAGQWLEIKSTDLWSDTAVNTYPSVTMGEWVYVTSVVGFNVTLAAPLLYDYTTSPTVTIYPLAAQIEAENLTFTSDNSSYTHGGVAIYYAINAVAKRITAYKCSYMGTGLYSSVYSYSEDCANYDPDPTLGLAYSVIIAYSTRDSIHVRPKGRNCRHITAHGGYAGVIASSTIIDAVGDDMFEGVIDAHASVDKQTVMFSNTSQFTSTNSKLISSQARRLTVVGAQSDKVHIGISWSPACTAYPASLSLQNCRVKANNNACEIGIATTQPVEYIDISGGYYIGGQNGANGDGIQITHSSNLTATSSTPGTIDRLNINGTYAYGYQRGVYLYGGVRNQKIRLSTILVDAESPNVAGSYPIYALATTLNDFTLLNLKGTVKGGNSYGARFDKITQVNAEVTAYNMATDVFYNNQQSVSDATNRYNLIGYQEGNGSTGQRFGTVTLNGTTGVTVNNKFARTAGPGSTVTFLQMTASGGTPGFPRVQSISNATSITFVSTSATDTSTWKFRVDNPVTGP